MVILHAGANPPTGDLYTHWYLEPTVALLVVGLVVAYFVLTGPFNRRYPGWEARTITTRQRNCFLGGCAALLVALGPPLDDWSGYFLLSAHMLQHIILIMLVPPLLLLGIPAWGLEPLTRNPITNRIGYTLTRPLVAWVIGALTMAVWHVPTLYDAALRNEPLHILEHQTYIITGLLAWWPIVGMLPAWPKPPPPLQCLYLFFTTIPGGVVGSVITMANPPIYEQYGIATRMWGLGVQTDQEIAGLMMWVGENTIYLLLITVIFLRWANAEERKDRVRPELPVSALTPSSLPKPPVEANGHGRSGVPQVGEGV